MKVRKLAVWVAVLAMLLAAHPVVSAPGGGGGGGSDSSCASASASIVTGTETVAPGTTVGIVGRATNCSSAKKRYTITFTGMSDCGQRADIASSRIAFRGGESYMFPVSYPMPYNTCTGPWTATVEVSDGGRVLATGTTTIIIQ